jgi:hypothetical protein
MANLWQQSALLQKSVAERLSQDTISDLQWGQGRASCPTDQTTKRGREEFGSWLADRGMEGTLVIPDVLKNPTLLKDTVVLPGLTVQDFLNDSTFKMPQSFSSKEEVWDLHLVDFDPRCWEGQRQFL